MLVLRCQSLALACADLSYSRQTHQGVGLQNVGQTSVTTKVGFIQVVVQADARASVFKVFDRALARLISGGSDTNLCDAAPNICK